MANSGRITKTSDVPGFLHDEVALRADLLTRSVTWVFSQLWRNPGGPWRDCTCQLLVTVRRVLSGSPVTGSTKSGSFTAWWRRESAPAVGGPGCPDQRVAQFTQFGCPGSFVKRRGDVLRRTSHLVDAIREVGRLVGRQHHHVAWQGRRLGPVDRGTLLVGPLLVGPLPTRLPAVLAATAHAVISHIATAPAARLRSRTTSHACRL